MSRLARPLLLAAGLACVALGAVGIVLPLLPTTPFLLLAVWCFARSSERLHRWLVEHRRLGVYVVGFVYGGGVPRQAKSVALTVLWVGIAVSCVIVVWRIDDPVLGPALAGLLIVIAVAVSVYIITRPSPRPGAGDAATERPPPPPRSGRLLVDAEGTQREPRGDHGERQQEAAAREHQAPVDVGAQGRAHRA